MRKIAFLLLILLPAMTLNAEILKIGRTASDPIAELANLRELGEYIIQKLDNDTYDSFKIMTDGQSDNSKFIKLINDEKIDIVMETLYSAAIYTQQANLEPVLLVNRKGNVYLKSYIIVRKDSAIHSIKELGGKIIALQNEISTPYFFLPIKEIMDAGLKVTEVKRGETNIPKNTVGYFLTHDKYQIANNVYLKKTDAGVLCSYEWEGEGTLPSFIKDGLRQIHATKSVPGLFILIRKDMPSDIKNKIINILADLNSADKNKSQFSKCEAVGFYKVGFDWQSLFKSVLAQRTVKTN